MSSAWPRTRACFFHESREKLGDTNQQDDDVYGSVKEDALCIRVPQRAHPSFDPAKQPSQHFFSHNPARRSSAHSSRRSRLRSALRSFSHFFSASTHATSILASCVPPKHQLLPTRREFSTTDLINPHNPVFPILDVGEFRLRRNLVSRRPLLVVEVRPVGSSSAVGGKRSARDLAAA